jgi:hypothetical protein
LRWGGCRLLLHLLRLSWRTAQQKRFISFPPDYRIRRAVARRRVGTPTPIWPFTLCRHMKSNQKFSAGSTAKPGAQSSQRQRKTGERERCCPK